MEKQSIPGTAFLDGLIVMSVLTLLFAGVAAVVGGGLLMLVLGALHSMIHQVPAASYWVSAITVAIPVAFVSVFSMVRETSRVSSLSSPV